jgi:sugar transferase (PEP-CTERM/EpsH1 system associated)
MYDALRLWRESVRFDVVVAFSSSMAPYALQVPAQRRVLDLCDLDSQKWLEYARASRGPTRWLYEREGRNLAQNERDWIDIFDTTLLITEAEAKTLNGTVRPGKIHIIGNGVKLPDLRGHIDYGTAQLRQPVVGFVGVMDYRPNIDAVCWFVSECWHEIRNACPDSVFRIVGRSPTRRVRRLARTPGVQVVGPVKDVKEEVQRFDVSVAPMRLARGLQNKVLEAMAAAKPVVLTTKAATGIFGEDGREFLVADRPAEIVDGVVWLLHDRDTREHIGQAARKFVAVNHSWEETLRTLEFVTTGIAEPTARPLISHPIPSSAQIEGLPVPNTV